MDGPLSRTKPGFEPSSERERSLRKLLDQSNGFHMKAAFLLLPSADDTVAYSIETYNAGAWKVAYGPEVSSSLFFALDALGSPFGICGNRICQLDPETGAFETFASDFRDLFDRVASSPESIGVPLVEAWTGSGRSLTLFQRLAPKVPFILGGRGRVEDLYAADILERRDFNADLHAQTKGLADGTSVKLHFE
jgi:hypothetical protein